MKTEWKDQALEKQVAFKKQLKLTDSGFFGGKKYEHILSNEDAGKGANFYCYNNQEEWNKLQAWAEESKGKKINFLGSGLKNMLRSEHIPYNFFYPLEKLRIEQDEKLSEFLESLFSKQIKVKKVNQIKIEYALDIHKSELLDDNTSFDVFIEFQNGKDLCGLGIEVKYTEKSYPYGTTEKARMWDEKSLYNRLSRKSRLYKNGSLHKLRTTKLKQAWRNHLLGLRIIELGKLDKFYSVHLYPEKNTYQAEVCKEYIECLNKAHQNNFKPITFKHFIKTAENIFSDTNKHLKWINYVKRRY